MKYSEAKEILRKKERAQAVLEEYKKVANAHEDFGFKSRRDFIKALQEIDQSNRKNGSRGPRGLAPETVDEIKRLKAEGQSNAAISRELNISALTVAKYVKGTDEPKAAKAPAAINEAPAAAPKVKVKRKTAKKKK